MMMNRTVVLGLAAWGLLLAVGPGSANNLTVTNVTIKPRDDSTAYAQFDIRWENSWCYTNINHDAAWVFFKIKPEGRTDWEHVTLETNGHVIGTGTVVDIVVPEDRVGCFIRRAGEGAGTVSVTNVKVAWNFTSNNLVKTDRVRIQACAVEMVYVAEGEFAAGSGGTEASAFTLTTINTNDASVAPSGTGSLGGEAGGYPTGQTAPHILSWPNGYSAFYCMKYEITQGQYRDFLNTLTRAQQVTHTRSQLKEYFALSGGTAISYRNGIRCPSSVPVSGPIVFGCDGNSNKIFNETNDAMDRACNWLDWTHGSALADWAGLRPMTELEYEKACRGPLPPVANEYAWGDLVISPVTAIFNDGSGMDTTTNGNCNCSPSVPSGPYRVGIFATTNSTRQAAGASYWGIMELSGNVAEWAVTIGHATGRLFTGAHGNGTLSASGNANVTNWPGMTDGEVTGRTGAGFRDSGWFFAKERARVSDRTAAINGAGDSFHRNGFRAVRTAP